MTVFKNKKNSYLTIGIPKKLVNLVAEASFSEKFRRKIMKFVQLRDIWINLSQIKYIRMTRIGVDIHFSSENRYEKISIFKHEGKILMGTLKKFIVNPGAND